MRLTVTALTHPTMMQKINDAALCAMTGNGNRMEGFDHRAYIQNRHGQRIMRVDYSPQTRDFTIWGPLSADISNTVKDAIQRVQGAVVA